MTVRLLFILMMVVASDGATRGTPSAEGSAVRSGAEGERGLRAREQEASPAAEESPLMAALEERVRAEGPDALVPFRAELESIGTPLVEPISGEASEVLVTFVWFAERERANVVVQSWLESRSVERRAMRELGDTGLWYRTFRAPADLAMGYLLSPDDVRLFPGAGEADVTDTWVRDPLNSHTARGALGMQWSVVNLSGRVLAPWMTDEGPRAPSERSIEWRVESEALGIDIPVRVVLPAGYAETESHPLLLFFDGFGFFDIDQAHRLVDSLTATGELRPTVVAFIYNPEATRSRDMSCYAPMHRFLEEELIPRLRDRFRSGSTPAETVIAGRSRSGLGAVCAAYEMPHVIGNAISQSGSFWWAPEGDELEWLARDMSQSPRRPISLYLDAGRLEDGPNPDSGLSMLTVTRHLRDVARARGYEAHYREFSGGHDPIGWRTTLPDALKIFLGP